MKCPLPTASVNLGEAGVSRSASLHSALSITGNGGAVHAETGGRRMLVCSIAGRHVASSAGTLLTACSAWLCPICLSKASFVDCALVLWPGLRAERLSLCSPMSVTYEDTSPAVVYTPEPITVVRDYPWAQGCALTTAPH